MDIEMLHGLMLALADRLPGEDKWSDDRIWLRWAVRLATDKKEMDEKEWERRWGAGMQSGEQRLSAPSVGAAHSHAYRAGMSYYQSMDMSLLASDREEHVKEAIAGVSAALAALKSPAPAADDARDVSVQLVDEEED